MPRIAILGAGFAGMAAGNVLAAEDAVVYEAEDRCGGHARSFRVGEFVFDEGPHVSFTSNERIRDFLALSVDGRFCEQPSYATNYFHGLTFPHPVQTNLRFLEPAMASRSIADFVRAQYEDRREIRNYGDWCYKSLGRSITEAFTRRYTRKYWNLELEDLTTEWVSQRIYAPKLEEVLDGALIGAAGQHYYMTSFRYPEQGGFEAYTKLLAAGCVIQPGARAIEIDLNNRQITFAQGAREPFERLVSTLPLPELIAMIKDAPPAVRAAAGKLACTSHLLISIGVNRPNLSDAFWTYVYDEDIPFSRLSFPSQYSPNSAPPECSSLQAEVVHSRFKPLVNVEQVVEETVSALLRMGLLRSRDEILACDVRNVKYANVVFNFDRTPNLGIVHRFLAEKGVETCGRYGDWDYLWTDQAILSGERAGRAIQRSFGLPATDFDGRQRAHAVKA